MDKETLDALNWVIFESSIWFKLWWLLLVVMLVRFGVWIDSVEKRINREND